MTFEVLRCPGANVLRSIDSSRRNLLINVANASKDFHEEHRQVRLFRLIRQQDFAAGLLFLVLGVGVAWGSTAYKLGTAMRMGPGYFPLLLGIAQALLGMVLIARNLRFDLGSEDPSLVERPCLRSLALIGISMLVFAFALQKAGLIVATIGLVVISGWAYPAFRWKELGLLGIVLASFASLVFAYGLGLPLRIFPT